MLSGILGFILGAAGITGHWFFTKLRPCPSPAMEMLQPDAVILSTSCVDVNADIAVSVNWKVWVVGDTLLTPMRNDYAAVIVHAVMEDNFYNVRLLSDSSKYLHIHASLLFSKAELDASYAVRN